MVSGPAMEAMLEIDKALEPLSVGQKRRVIRNVNQHFKGLEAVAKHAQENGLYDAMTEIQRWIADFPDHRAPVEKPQSSLFHQLEDAIKQGRLAEDDLRGAAITPTNIFLVEHDWVAVLKLSDETSRDVRLPFPRCAFEFQIGGRRVITSMDDDGDKLSGHLFFQSATWWVHAPLHTWPLIEHIIRATCVMLEAEVATADLVRAPEDANRIREKKGRAPLRSYHVVRLDRRERGRPAEESAGVERRSPRLHFRRGHWRHFAASRTWIKWTLVGDPDLGFVDKDYRL